MVAPAKPCAALKVNVVGGGPVKLAPPLPQITMFRCTCVMAPLAAIPAPELPAMVVLKNDGEAPLMSSTALPEFPAINESCTSAGPTEPISNAAAKGALLPRNRLRRMLRVVLAWVVIAPPVSPAVLPRKSESLIERVADPMARIAPPP
jgi:hypothetical protein